MLNTEGCTSIPSRGSKDPSSCFMLPTRDRCSRDGPLGLTLPYPLLVKSRRVMCTQGMHQQFKCWLTPLWTLHRHLGWHSINTLVSAPSSFWLTLMYMSRSTLGQLSSDCWSSIDEVLIGVLIKYWSRCWSRVSIVTWRCMHLVHNLSIARGCNKLNFNKQSVTLAFTTWVNKETLSHHFLVVPFSKHAICRSTSSRCLDIMFSVTSMLDFVGVFLTGLFTVLPFNKGLQSSRSSLLCRQAWVQLSRSCSLNMTSSGQIPWLLPPHILTLL